MKLYRVLFVMMILLISLNVEGQREKKRERKKSDKEQADASRKQADEWDAKYTQKQDHHKEIQTKATLRRMKKSRKKSERLMKHKPEPFWKRKKPKKKKKRRHKI